MEQCPTETISIYSLVLGLNYNYHGFSIKDEAFMNDFKVIEIFSDYI